MAACQGGRLVVHFTNRKNAPLLFSTLLGTPPNAYTFEQVEAFVTANPSRWMANPYSGDGTAVTLEHDLQQLHASGTGIGYLAYGVHLDGQPPRIEGTRYFYRDGVELTEEHEAFEELSGR